MHSQPADPWPASAIQRLGRRDRLRRQTTTGSSTCERWPAERLSHTFSSSATASAATRLRRRSFRRTTPIRSPRFVDERASQTDVYIGCAPRARRSGTRNDIDQVWVLWAECDGAEAARAALSYRPTPSIVIGSGSGQNLHAYWPLRACRSARPRRRSRTSGWRTRSAPTVRASMPRASFVLRARGTTSTPRRRRSSPCASSRRTGSILARFWLGRRRSSRDTSSGAGATRPARDPGRDGLLCIPPVRLRLRAARRQRACGAEGPLPLPCRRAAQPACLCHGVARLVVLLVRARRLDLRPRWPSCGA